MGIQLTEAEAKIIALLWEESPLTMMQITRKLKDATGWTKHTVINILKRMLIKGTIRMEDLKPAKLYYPLVEKESVEREETQTFLDKVYGGNPVLLLSAMVDGGKLQEQEIDELLAILNKAKEAGRHE
jgi:BlaI family penicillinase repressor